MDHLSTAGPTDTPLNPVERTPGTAARRFGALAFVTAGFTYALVVFGGVVRITGSGMGCGDDWPLCHGQLIPPIDFETLIEYGHRLVAALLSFLVLVVAVYAWRHRRSAGIAGRGVLGWALAALALLIVQVLVGAVTVWLELAASTVILHLALASALLATLIIAGLRARKDRTARGSVGGPVHRWVWGAATLGFTTLILGAMVANTGAAPLCQGFPLCNGQFVPAGGGLVHLHWMHRLAGYALLIVAAVAAVRTIRVARDATASRAALLALGLVIAQIVIAAAMVLLHLPTALQVLHLAVGAGLWAALVVWATAVRSELAPTVTTTERDYAGHHSGVRSRA
jgi:heme A synthase